MIKPPPVLPSPAYPWFDPKTGLPTTFFADYLRDLDAAVRALIAEQNGGA